MQKKVEENENLKKKLQELEKLKEEKNKEAENLKINAQGLNNEKNNKIISDNNEMQLNAKIKEKEDEIKNFGKRLTEIEALLNSKNNNNNFTNDNKELQKLFAKLDEKEKEIESLNDQLIGSIKYDDIKNDDKLIVVNFTSLDNKINFPIICKASSLFAEAEYKLYKKYPEYLINAEEDNYFLANGKKMGRIRTMIDNGFSGYTVTLMKNNN